jgi:predicted transcriptional regulator
MGELYNTNLKRLLWYLFAGMKGGPTRVRMLKLILKRPYNINQIGKELHLDYKTVQHHIKVLEENRLIMAEDKKYGKIFFPTPIMEQNIKTFEEISEKIKEDK